MRQVDAYDICGFERVIDGRKWLCLQIVFYRGVVTSAGIHLDLYRGGVHLTFPPGSVTESTTIMVHRWKYGACLPTLGEHEAVVSNVIEISANKEVEALEFEDEVKLALSHSAPDLEGYELVVKKLLDAETNEWDEVDGCENIRGISGFNICFMKSLFRC